MRATSRRSFLAILAALSSGRAAAAPQAQHARFVDAAFKMKQDAVAAGDQAYGAVVVRAGEIVGFGPSRVIAKKDATAHAEREAIRDAQARLNRSDLSDCAMDSSSRPCSACERVAAEARLARMYYGPDATEGGVPRAR
jgi:tRNA(Arg) A34 adenosine deaminase TadA